MPRYSCRDVSDRSHIMRYAGHKNYGDSLVISRQVNSPLLFLFLLSSVRTHGRRGAHHPHSRPRATPSPRSETLAKRQVVSRRIRPTSWFKESRGQDF